MNAAQILNYLALTERVGLNGFLHTTATSPQTGAWNAINANVDTVIASVTEANSSGTTNITLKAGATLYGNFTGFTLTSGEVTAYKWS